MDREAWRATVHGVERSRTRLSGQAEPSTVAVVLPEEPYAEWALHSAWHEARAQ